MISFLLLTTDAKEARDRLIERGIVRIEVGQLVGAKFGFEWAEVPNPIITVPGTEDILPVYDPRRCFLCKFAHDLEADETEGEEDTKGFLLRTKFGKWIASRATRDDLPDGTPAWKVGLKFWLVPDHSQLAVWQ